MNGKSVLYWLTTALVALAFFVTGILNLIGNDHILNDIVHLGYPVYIMKLLGFWKLLAAIAILLPKTAVLKEWAYAGMLLDLSGAAFSRISVGDPPVTIIVPLLILALVVFSWASRSESRRLFQY